MIFGSRTATSGFLWAVAGLQGQLVRLELKALRVLKVFRALKARSDPRAPLVLPVLPGRLALQELRVPQALPEEYLERLNSFKPLKFPTPVFLLELHSNC